MTNRKLVYMAMALGGMCILSIVICFVTAFYVAKNTQYNNKIAKNNVNDVNFSDSSYQNKNYDDNYNNKDKENENNENNKKVENNIEEIEEEYTSKMVMANNTINESTKMVYQYYYKNDGIMEESEEVPPYFLLGFDFNDMLEYYPDWQIISFSDKEVIMRKILEEDKEKNFIVTQKDGYIAVYYDNADEGTSLYEITETPVSALTHDEQIRINDGILVKGEYELAKILAEYNS